MNMTKLILSSCISVIMLFLFGCQTHTISVNDGTQVISVPKSPSHIVVMNFGALDTLDALGKGKNIVGAPLSNLPEYLKQYHHSNIINVGSMKAPDLETIKAIKPDLIIIDGRQSKYYQKLSTIAPTIKFTIDSKNYFDSVKNNITLLGKITEQKIIADNYINLLKDKMTAARAIAQSSNKIAMIALHNNGKLMLVNQGNYAALIYDTLTVKRAVPLSELPPAQSTQSKERPKPIVIDNAYIASKKPDILFIIDRSEAIGQKAINKHYFDEKVLNNTGTKVLHLKSDLWYLSGGGIESLNQQIDAIISALN